MSPGPTRPGVDAVRGTISSRTDFDRLPPLSGLAAEIRYAVAAGIVKTCIPAAF